MVFGRRAPARLLDQRLVVPQAQRRTGQSLRRAGHARIQGEAAHRLILCPHVHVLRELGLVRRAMGRQALRGAQRRLAKRERLLSRDQLPHDGEAVLLVGAMLGGGDGARAHEVRGRGHAVSPFASEANRSRMMVPRAAVGARPWSAHF